MKAIYVSVMLKLFAIAVCLREAWIQGVDLYKNLVLHQSSFHSNLSPQYDATVVLSASLHGFWQTLFFALAAWFASDIIAIRPDRPFDAVLTRAMRNTGVFLTLAFAGDIFQIQWLNGGVRPEFDVSLETLAMCTAGIGLFLIASRAQKMTSDLEAII